MALALHLDPSQIKKVLVIKLRAIGDVLLSTVVTKNLREAYPQATVDFLTDRSNGDVLVGNRYIDEIILFDRSPANGLKVLFDLRRRKYDLVIDLFGNPRSAFMTFASGAKYRVGYAFRGRKHAYNVRVKPRGDSVHNTEFNLDALRAVGVRIMDRSVHFPLTPESEEFASRFLGNRHSQGRTLVALNPSGGWYTKRWRLEQYAALGDRIAQKFGADLLLIWGPGEYKDAEALKSMMHHEALMPPATDLKELGALLKKCSLLVTNDSGPMHIAAAVGTPVVAIFGPTSPKLQGPHGNKHVVVRNERLDCLECNFTKCPIGNICMTELSVGDVMAGVEKLLAESSIKSSAPMNA